MTEALGPFKLVTVNTAPERAKKLVGIVVEDLKERFNLIHEANCSSIADVATTVRSVKPDMVMCASMWTAEEADQIQSIARKESPDIKFHAIPQGLQVEKGPEAIVEHLKDVLPKILSEGE